MPPTEAPALKGKLPAEVNAAIEYNSSNRHVLLYAAEQIIRTQAPNIQRTGGQGGDVSERNIRRQFSSEELDVFDSLHWAPKELLHEVARIQRVMDLQSAAGTTEQRENVAGRLKACRDKLEKRRPIIQEQIARLNQELTDLERPIEALQREFEHRSRAVAQLREKVPGHVAEEFQRRRGLIKAGCRAEISAAENALRNASQPFDDQISEAQTKVTQLETRLTTGIALHTLSSDERSDLERQIAAAKERLAGVRLEKENTLPGLSKKLADAKEAQAEEFKALERELLDCYAR